jgi:8-oxo-dGTP pyrophosphatase MutT (NUDIX family)
MAREPIPSWYFVLVVVRQDDKFLLVHERKHEQKWYLPAGRIEPRETFIQAAYRETLEETGVPIVIEGILGIQHTPILDGTARVRFILLASPQDETSPKSEPDEESLGAAWMTLEEMREVELRGKEVLQIFQYVANGGAVYPLSLITTESPMYYGGIPTKNQNRLDN